MARMKPRDSECKIESSIFVGLFQYLTIFLLPRWAPRARHPRIANPCLRWLESVAVAWKILRTMKRLLTVWRTRHQVGIRAYKSKGSSDFSVEIFRKHRANVWEIYWGEVRRSLAIPKSGSPGTAKSCWPRMGQDSRKVSGPCDLACLTQIRLSRCSRWTIARLTRWKWYDVANEKLSEATSRLKKCVHIFKTDFCEFPFLAEFLLNTDIRASRFRSLRAGRIFSEAT